MAILDLTVDSCIVYMTSIPLQDLLEHSFTGIWNFIGILYIYCWNILNSTPGFLKKCVRLGLLDFLTFLSKDFDGFIGSLKEVFFWNIF